MKFCVTKSLVIVIINVKICFQLLLTFIVPLLYVTHIIKCIPYFNM